METNTPSTGGFMHTDSLVIWTVVSTTIIVSVSFIATIISWGLTTMGECLPSNFDPSCYSISPNDDVEVDDPMWWPHDNE